MRRKNKEKSEEGRRKGNEGTGGKGLLALNKEKQDEESRKREKLWKRNRTIVKESKREKTGKQEEYEYVK